MKQRNITPGKEKVLERRLSELRRELRDEEGLQRRGFLNQSDETAAKSRIQRIRTKIAEIEEELE